MTDMRATERLLEVIEGRIGTILRQFDRADSNADAAAAIFTMREHVLSIQVELAELRRRGDTLVRAADLRLALENDYNTDRIDPLSHREAKQHRDAYDRLESALGGKPL